VRSIDLCLIVAVLATTCAVEAEVSTVATGIPYRTCTTTPDTTYCEPVPTERAGARRMTIVKESTGPLAKYHWVIDGQPRREIAFVGDDMYKYDVYSCNAGLVVIQKTSMIWKEVADGKPRPNFRYMEITRGGLMTITSYGDLDRYDP
jgi:hypothetical protein